MTRALLLTLAFLAAFAAGLLAVTALVNPGAVESYAYAVGACALAFWLVWAALGLAMRGRKRVIPWEEIEGAQRRARERGNQWINHR